jgi:hypothetical protein
MAWTNITLFSQILHKIDRSLFKSNIKKHNSDKYSKGIDTWMHLCSMLFCHLSCAKSLREICNGLKSISGNLNHLGLSKAPAKSTLSYANKTRDWKVFQALYFDLHSSLHALKGHQKVKFKLKSRILLLDSTTISLCIKLFDWAKYRRQKGAIKLHTLLEYDTCLPCYIFLSDGKKSDVKVAQELALPKNSVVVADRAYLDFTLLSKWDTQGTHFVVRLKSPIRYEVVKTNPLPENKDYHVLSDEIIRLTGTGTSQAYTKNLRRVVVFDPETENTIELVTNQTTWTAATIGELYRQRWQIEIFFKEIKQHLNVKTFIGTSENAVMIQIWTAMISILLLKYLKAIGKEKWSLSNLVAFLRMNLFVKIDLQYWLDKPFTEPPETNKTDEVQLKLF